MHIKIKLKMKKMKNYLVLVSAWTMLATGFTACKKEETEDPHDHDHGEVITTLQLVLNNGAGFTDTVSFRDPDGAGGLAPTIDSLVLPVAGTYTMNIVLLNEATSPVDTVSAEVAAEATTHQFVYSVNPASGLLAAVATDTDVNGNPLGLSGTLTALASGSGTFNLKLRHYASPADKSNGTSNYDSDIDITFGLRVQ